MEINEDFEETDLDEIDLLIADQSNPVHVPITYPFWSLKTTTILSLSSPTSQSDSEEEESSDEDDASVSQSDEE